LEALGQQPLELGSALGGRIANTSGANALLQGGMGAAQSQFSANAYNPFASALTGFSQNPAFASGVSNLFGGGGGGGFTDIGGMGAAGNAALAQFGI
jgi:hypothetical protein